MRRFSAICMAALLVFVMSCKKKEAGDETGVRGFRASLETQADGSKTHLEDGVKVKWDASDAILVINNENVAQEFITATGETSDGYADFEANVGADFFTPKYMGFYPSTLYNAETNTVTLPETQQFALVNGEGSFGKGFSPMVAQSTDNNLEFKNICGMLALQFVGEKRVSKVTLTSKTSEMLCGTAELTMTGDDFDMMPALGTLSDGSNHITLNCGSGVQLSATAPTIFYFVLPDNTLGSGFSVKLTFTDAEELNLNAGPGNNTLIQRNKIKFMMPLDAETGEAVDPLPVVTMTEGCKYCTHAVQGVVTSSWAGNCEFGFVYSATEETPTIENATKLVVGTEAMPKNVPFVADLGEFFANPSINGQTCHVRAYAQVPGGSAAYCDNVVTMTSDNYPQPMAWTWNLFGDDYSQVSILDFTVAIKDHNGIFYQIFEREPEYYQEEVVRFTSGNLVYDENGKNFEINGYTYPSEHYYLEEQQYYTPYDDKEKFVSPEGYDVTNYNPNHVTNFHFSWNMEEARAGLWNGVPSDAEEYEQLFPNEYLYDENGHDLNYHHTNPVFNNELFVINGDYNPYRVLADWEWYCLFYERPNHDKLFGMGRLGKCPAGLIILPDQWEWTGMDDLASRWQPGFQSDYLNTFTYVEWARMEAKGAVFIPAGGVGQCSEGNYTITGVWDVGKMWLCHNIDAFTSEGGEDASTSNYFDFSPSASERFVGGCPRYNALPIRLVETYAPPMK